MLLRWQDVSGFAFTAQVQVLMRGVCSYENLKKLARDIYMRHVRHPEFDRALHNYMNVCYTIDGIKIKTIGKVAPTNRSNVLMQAISAYFAADMDRSEKNKATIRSYLDLSAAGVGTQTWFYAKLQSLEGFIMEVERVESLASRLIVDPMFGQQAKDFMEEHSVQAAKDATTMIHELAVLRKYGVKNSFFQDGMLHDPSQAWVFMDYYEIRKLVTAWDDFIPEQFAFISVSDKASLTEGIGVLPSVREVGVSKTLGAKTTFGGYAFMALDTEGEMDASYGLGFLPVRQFFERSNNIAAYEYLRYAQAIRLYDLVVPVARVEGMPKPPIERGMLDRIKNVLKKKQLLNPELLIPRMRSLENIDVLLRELETEIEMADTETVKRSREISRHEVIWHIRRLPKGKRATPEARKRAEEHGIVLAENETYVRPHERGKGELQRAVHEAKSRR